MDKTLTKQEIFDKVWNHFVTEGNPVARRRLSVGTSTCQYRTNDGRKCAIGIFIPDEMYSLEMEGRGYGRIIEMFPQVATLFPGIDSQFLGALQDAHDGNYGTIKSRLMDLAGQYSLNTPPDFPL